MLVNQIALRMAQIKVIQQHLDPKQLRNLCLKQEQAVMAQLTKIRTFDLYEQIAKVCPSQADLKLLPNEEITNRLNTLTHFPSSASQNSNSHIGFSAGEGSAVRQEQNQVKVEQFLPFNHPTLKNFLDEVEESLPFWQNMDACIE